MQDRCYYGGIDPPPTYTDDLDPLDNVLGVGGRRRGRHGDRGDPPGRPASSTSPSTTTTATATSTSWASSTPAPTWPSRATRATPGRTRSRSRRSCDVAEGVRDLPTRAPLRGGLLTTTASSSTASSRCRSSTEAGDTLNIGVATHEMAHALGEPDYYAVNGSSSGDGDWDIMSGGSYMGNPSGSNPIWFNPATRVFQGWLKPTIVHGDLRELQARSRARSRCRATPSATAEPEPPARPDQVDERRRHGRATATRGPRATCTACCMDPATRATSIEGYYLEYASRTAGPHEPIHGA